MPTHSDPAALLAALNWRYATKVFDPARTIPAPLMNALEEALVLAPSSYGLQPYRFLVITDRTLREQLRPHTWDQRQVVDCSHFVVFAARTTMTEGEIDTYVRRMAATRQVTPESLAGLRGMMAGSLLKPELRGEIPHWAAKQAYIALGQLMTAAALLRVDACPMEGFVPERYNEILDLAKDGLSAVVCCALGYRSAQDKYASLAKVRLPLAEAVRRL